jgi:hypothetical protein
MPDAGTPGTATPTPHASPVIHNVVIHVAPFRARGPAAPELPTHPIRRAQALSSTVYTLT